LDILLEESLFLDDGRLDLSGDNGFEVGNCALDWLVVFLSSDNWVDRFMNDVSLGLFNNLLVLLVYDFLKLLVNNWLVDLVNMLLVDDWLMKLVNDWLMVLVDHLLMLLSDHVFVMFMDDILMGFLDDGLLLVGLVDGCLLMLDILGLLHDLVNDRLLSDSNELGFILDSSDERNIGFDSA
jgi:hypothetical protein